MPAMPLRRPLRAGAVRLRIPVSLREALAYRPMLVLLALGVVVRVLVTALYFPAVMMSFDSPRFARVHPSGLFSDFWMPAGYPALLRVLHAITDELWFTIAVQHLMGMVAGVLVFLAARRLGAPAWAACIPAGALLLAGDHLYLEHIVMADVLMLHLAVAGLAAAVWGLVPRPRPVPLVVAGALLAMSGLSRSVAMGLVAVLVACVLVWAGPGLRRRLTAAGSAAAGAAAALLLYAGAYHASGGVYLGLTDMGGWNLYSRVAPFADCREFTPPAGTEVLCETRPPSERPGPLGYVWDVNAVSRKTFELGPRGARALGEFARQAILHQPEDYLRAVAVDLARYVEPSIGGSEHGYAGQAREVVSFGWREPEVERLVGGAMSQRYDGTEVRVHGRRLLGAYQQLVRVDRLALLALLALTLWGAVAGRGPLRLGVALFGLSGLALYVLPVIALSYDFRYGIPAGALVTVSGVLGGLAVLERRRARRGGEG